MAIVLNAGSTPNGQMPSIRIYGDGNVGEHSLLGNFGELLTLISADAKNALHENELNPQITVKQTSEALLALAKNGNEEAKNIVASILQRASPENQNPITLSLKENIQTSSFLEAKIENKLEQQGLLKPSKTLEFLSLSDLVTFADDLLSKTAGGVEQNARNEGIMENTLDTENNFNKDMGDAEASVVHNLDMFKGNNTTLDLEILNKPLIPTGNNEAVDLETPKEYRPIGDVAFNLRPGIIDSAKIPEINESLKLSATAISATDAEFIPVPNISNSTDAFPKQSIENILMGVSMPDRTDNLYSNGQYSLTEKNQKILKLIKDILQVSSPSLIIDEHGPSEVIFDLRDLKNAVIEKLTLPMQNEAEVRTPKELIIPYTLPLNFINKSDENFSENINNDKPDVLEVTRISLDGKLIELPVPNKNNSSKNIYEDPEVFTVKGGELVLNSVKMPQRKLVIGISIPKETIVSKLPDFVKIQINSDNEKVSAEGKGPSTNINKDYLTSNLIELPKDELRSIDNTYRLIKNMHVLLNTLGVKDDEFTDQINIISVNNSGKVFQQNLPDPVNKELLNTEDPSQNLINRSSSVVGYNYEKGQQTEYLDTKINLIGQDRLPLLLNLGIFNKPDIKKYSDISRLTTSALALNTNENFFVKNSQDFRELVLKEKFTPSTGHNAIIGGASSETYSEFLDKKNVYNKILENVDIKKIIQAPDVTLTQPETGNKSINSSQIGGERNPFLNNVSLAPTLAANKISLYEAQYASRLGMAVVEKVRAGRENFDIHLQPESFGKIKVNVTLDFRAIDVKIFTETLGAAAIFKDHENTLQQIMEQNGMKLASFTVGAQNGNDQQRQFANQNRDRTIGKATGRGNKVINTPNTSENSNGEPTGLNLIA